MAPEHAAHPGVRAATAYAGPAIAVVFTGYALHATGVAAADIATYAAYLVLGLALPGVAMWRMVLGPSRWSFLGDLAAGVSLAYAVELGVYLVCAHLDVPELAMWWPLVPLGLSALPRWRPEVWRRSAGAAPTWVRWFLSALVVYLVAYLARSTWNAYPITGEAGGRVSYVDMPYHLSLIGALSRHVPVDVPAVAGEPLYYHWFVHASLAAERHATGIEPLVLLTRLGPLAMAVATLLGVTALTVRLTRSWGAGALAAGLLCLAGGPAFDSTFGQLFLAPYLTLSPTTTFAMALVIAILGLSFTLLVPERTTRAAPAWVALFVTLGAVSGAKAVVLPMLLAGYVAAVLMKLLTERRWNLPALAMAAMTVAWFLVSQQLVYGGSSQGTALEPFDFGTQIARGYRLTDSGSASAWLAAAITAVYLVDRLTTWIPAAGLFSAETRRDPRAHLLVGAGLSAAGAVAAFGNDGFNQIYFLRTAPPFLVVGAAWGLWTVAHRLPAALARRAVATGVVGGAVLGFVAWQLDGVQARGKYSTASLLLPTALALVGCAVVALGWVFLRRRSGAPAQHLRASTAVVALVAGASLGIPITADVAWGMVTTPRAQFRSTPDTDHASIGRGGIEAARWLRARSAPGDLVATNSHCLYAWAATCDHRTTWIAAFTERQMLLEGWAYTSRSAAEAEKAGTSAAYVPFWDPALLDANDRLFSHPTPERAAVLRDKYGVDWLFVDRRFPADVPGLRKVARQVHRDGQYVVLRLR